MDVDTVLGGLYELVAPHLSEKQRRLLAGAAATALGRGGGARMARISGLSRPTVYTGMHELDDPPDPTGRVRRPGGGPKRLVERQPGLLEALDKLVDPDTRGDPESPLRWTCKSTRELADALGAQGFQVSDDTVGRLLKQQRYTLQRTQKTPMPRRAPSTPTGTPSSGMSTSRPRRSWPPGSRSARPSGWGCTTSPTLRSARRSLRGLRPGRRRRLGECWDRPRHRRVRGGDPWALVGAGRPGRLSRCRPAAGDRDAGGSNGYRLRRWKTELARFAAATGLAVTVCHFPPGTSKWNKIEHRLFSHITANWRGRPLVSHEVVVDLIGATRTRSGLRVRAELDEGRYPLGVKVSNKELAAVPLKRHDWHGDWNYTVLPAAA